MLSGLVDAVKDDGGAGNAVAVQHAGAAPAPAAARGGQSDKLDELSETTATAAEQLKHMRESGHVVSVDGVLRPDGNFKKACEQLVEVKASTMLDVVKLMCKRTKGIMASPPPPRAKKRRRASDVLPQGLEDVTKRRGSSRARRRPCARCAQLV